MSMPKVLTATEAPVLRCLRCGSTHIHVIREIRVAGSNRFVDTRCVACGEQSVLKVSSDVDE